MLIRTPLNKDRVRNHIAYSNWKYALTAVMVIFGWSLIFTTTAYHSPQNKRIDLYAMTATATADSMDAFLEPLWREVTPEMETVSSVALMMVDEYTSFSQLTAYIAAADGDIYFLTEQFFKTFAAQEAFLPLEGLVADGAIKVSDQVNLTKGYVKVIEDYDEAGAPITAGEHLYGIPLDTYYGFMNEMQLDNRGLYAVILSNNQNDENVIPFFAALLEAGEGVKPDFIQESNSL